MDAPVLIKTYFPPEIKRSEIFRYAGVKTPDEKLNALLSECLKETEGKLTYKVCYKTFPVTANGNEIDLSFCKTTSKDLKVNLDGATEIILFAATIGLYVDRLIAKYNLLSPVKALFFQAIGAERIESLCDAFNEDITNELEKKGKFTRPRFSAGYGDFGIEFQKDIFAALSVDKNIGVKLNDSLLMTPSKSVTAIIGVSDKKANRKEKCADCKKDCPFRRTK